MSITARQLAGKVGLTENAIRKLEAGDSREPRFSTGLRIAAELDIEPAVLAGLSNANLSSKAPDLAATIRQIRSCKQMLTDAGIEHVRIFGSVARGDAGPDSDIDFVVETPPGVRFSLVDLAQTTAALERILNRPVDVVTSKMAANGPIAAKIAEYAVDVF